MNSNQMNVIKCHKCRFILLDDLSLVSNDLSTCGSQDCESYNINKCVYLNEEKLPCWIKIRIENEQWTKGRFNCEKCGCRVGAFDYISGRKCDCGKTVLPPVHFIASQIDRPILISSINS